MQRKQWKKTSALSKPSTPLRGLQLMTMTAKNVIERLLNLLEQERQNDEISNQLADLLIRHDQILERLDRIEKAISDHINP